MYKKPKNFEDWCKSKIQINPPSVEAGNPYRRYVYLNFHMNPEGWERNLERSHGGSVWTNINLVNGVYKLYYRGAKKPY